MPHITITLTEEEASSAIHALRGYTLDAGDDGEEDEPRIIAANTARNKIVDAEKNADHDRIQASAGRKARRITKGLNEKGEYTERLGLGDFRYWSASRPLDPFTKIVVTEWRRIPRGAIERQYQGLKNALQCEIFDKVEG